MPREFRILEKIDVLFSDGAKNEINAGTIVKQVAANIYGIENIIAKLEAELTSTRVEIDNDYAHENEDHCKNFDSLPESEVIFHNSYGESAISTTNMELEALVENSSANYDHSHSDFLWRRRHTRMCDRVT